MSGWLPPGCTDKDIDEACPGYNDEPEQEEPRADHVYGYFVEELGEDPDDPTLLDLPLSSPCGQDCKRVIDWAKLSCQGLDPAAHRNVIRGANIAIEVLWRG